MPTLRALCCLLTQFAMLFAMLIAILMRPALAQSPDEAAIRTTLAGLEQASNARDSARIMQYAHENIVMISKNGETVVGKPALARYLQKMFGMAPSLKGLHSRVRLSANPDIRGQHAIAHGVSDDIYDFSDGMQLRITTIWSTTLVKSGAQWQIASVHFSFNLFDNPLLDGARWLAWITLLATLAGAALLPLLCRTIWYKVLRRRAPVE